MKSIVILVFSSLLSLASSQYFEAIAHHDLAQLQHLIATGVDVEQRDAAGATPLMMAASTSQVAMVRALLEAGADINARMPSTSQGSAVMQLAAKYANLETIQLLLQYQPALEHSLFDLAYSNRADVDTPAIARQLLEAGAPIDEVSHFYDVMDDRAILDYLPCLRDMGEASYNGGGNACAGQVGEVMLQAFNADHSRNLQQPDSLRFAAMFAGPRLVQTLIDVHAADPNEVIVRAKGNQRNARATTTPLELALYKHNRGAVQVLLAHGADVTKVHPVILQRATFDAHLREILQQAGVDTAQLQADFQAQNSACKQEVNQSSMVSFILDDGDHKDLELIRYIFAPRQQVGTLALIGNLVGKQHYSNIEEIRALLHAGWEVASHSLNHRNQVDLDAAALRASMANSQQMLETMGFSAATFVYPYGGHNAQVREQAAQYYHAAFAGGYKLNDRHSNPFALQRFNISAKHNYNDYQRILERAIREKKWLVWAVHPAYDTGWQQQENLARLLDDICARGVAVVTVSEGLARLESLP